MRLAPHLLLLASSFAILVAVPTPAPRAGEPPLQIVLTVDGSPHVLVDGQSAEIELAAGKIRAKVEVRPVRRFEGAGVAFDFRRDMGWSHDSGTGYELWTLDGDDVVVHVQSYATGEPAQLAKQVLRSALKELGVDPSDTDEVEVRLGSLAVDGIRAEFEVFGMRQEYTAAGVRAKDRPVVLLLQDTAEIAGSDEIEQTLGLLRDTFVIQE